MPSSILGSAQVLPGEHIAGAILTNQRLSELMEGARQSLDAEFEVSSPEFPLERVGIEQRRVLDADLCTRHMAVEAARRALAKTGLEPERINVLVVASVTNERIVPSLASTVQSELGLPVELVAFDLNLGCNGFMMALQLADQLLAARPGGYALVVGADAMTRVMDARDRTTCTVFGDGAGAMVLEAGSKPGLEMFVHFTFGDRGSIIEITPAGDSPPLRFVATGGDVEMRPDSRCFQRVVMAGRQVFRDMLSIMPERIDAYLKRFDLRPDLVLFHQANRRLFDGIAQRIGIDPQRVLCNIDRVGNTTSASIPILYSEKCDEGLITRGTRILLVGFGTGYSLSLAHLTV